MAIRSKIARNFGAIIARRGGERRGSRRRQRKDLTADTGQSGGGRGRRRRRRRRQGRKRRRERRERRRTRGGNRGRGKDTERGASRGRRKQAPRWRPCLLLRLIHPSAATWRALSVHDEQTARGNTNQSKQSRLGPKWIYVRNYSITQLTC